MEVAGLALAGLALIGPLTKCGIEVKETFKKIKSSRRDISKLADDTVIFAGLCTDFLQICANEHKAHADKSAPIKCLIAWIRKMLKALRKILQKVKALDQSPLSLQDKIIAYIEWFFSTSTVERLRANINFASVNIQGFTNVMFIEKINEELRMLKRALKQPSKHKEIEGDLGMSIGEKIDLLKKSIEIKTCVHETSKEKLKAAKSAVTEKPSRSYSDNFVPAIDKLFVFETSFNTFSEEVLPSRQPSRWVRRPKASSNQYAPRASTRPHTSTSSTSTGIDNASIPSASILSSRSDSTSRAACSSMSSNSSNPRNIPEPLTVQTPKDRQTLNGSTRTGTQAKEYFNDPKGTILSPPKAKVRDASASQQKEAHLGRHTITLNATEIVVNKRSLHMDDYQMGLRFFETLLNHEDKLDLLTRAIRAGVEDWDGIPGWVVQPSKGTTRTVTSSVRDV
ncbi:hypothetical protein OPT61_g5914 [Boeremia exigua]|uniref:Uncharacterized protein n=1 Tax=Boeremia exigua TaxID=749465 RepID=A0ACC2I8P3_9PLEO|nr:hypothetical protein OPT61_g5914 [Boeremia exigua]